MLLHLWIFLTGWTLLAPPVTSFTDRQSLESDGYNCLESRLSTDLPGPFKVPVAFPEFSGIEESSWDESRMPPNPLASAFWNRSESHSGSIPENITVLKDGTICFKEGDESRGAVQIRAGDEGPAGVKSGGRRDLRRSLEQAPSATGDAEIDVADFGDVRVEAGKSSQFPFTAIGSLENSCTGSLIGRCHVLTAGHCVLNPGEFQVSTRLKFTPAQNGPISSAPFGTFDFSDVKVARRWAVFSDPAHDVAVIHVKGIADLVDKELGYLHVGDGHESEELTNLNIAGYPQDKTDGHLWYDYCEKIPFVYGKRLFVTHTCHVEKGNSGSPMWVYKKDSGIRQTRALHVAELNYGRRLSDNTEQIIDSAPQAVILSGFILGEINSWMDEMPCE